MRIYLSTWLEKSQKEVLDAKTYEPRLLSYYFLVVSNKNGNKDLYLQNREENETQD